MKKTVRIILAGTGNAPKKSMESLLSDHIAENFSDFDVTWIVPLTATFFPHPDKTFMGEIVDGLVADDEAIIVVEDLTDSPTTRAVKSIVNSASEKFISKRGFVRKLANEALKADESQMIAFWDGEDKALSDMMEEALHLGVRVFSLFDGMSEMDVTAEEEETEEDDEAVGEEELGEDEEEEDEEVSPPTRAAAAGLDDDEWEAVEVRSNGNGQGMDFQALVDKVAQELARRITVG